MFRQVIEYEWKLFCELTRYQRTITKDINLAGQQTMTSLKLTYILLQQIITLTSLYLSFNRNCSIYLSHNPKLCV
jgi:hypothetical protein